MRRKLKNKSIQAAKEAPLEKEAPLPLLLSPGTLATSRPAAAPHSGSVTSSQSHGTVLTR